MKMSVAIPPSLAVTLLVMSSSCGGVMVIDLTYELKEGENIKWPFYPDYNLTILTRGYSPLLGGKWLEYNKFGMAEHTGTHMDAPSHFGKDRWRVHQIPSSHLVGPGVVIDVTEKVNGNADYAITVDDLKDWESRNGRIPAGAVMLMRSGWGKRYPYKERVFNTNDPSNSSTFHFPGWSGEVASWLAEKRSIIALGGDTPSSDIGQSTTYPVHEILLYKNIMILENVAHLDRMPVTGTTVVMGVVNIYDGSGGPMRILALLDLNCARDGARDDVRDSRNDGCRPLQTSAASLVFSVAVSSLLAAFCRMTYDP